MKRKSNVLFADLPDFLAASNVPHGTAVNLHGMVSNDADNRLFLVEAYEDLDHPERRIELRYPKLYAHIRSCGVPLRTPQGIYFEAQVSGKLCRKAYGRLAIDPISFLRVHRIACIGN